MATGKQAFAASSAALIFDGILHKDPAPPVQLNPELPAELDRIIRKAMVKKREDRYASTRELLADLKRLQMQISSGTRIAIPMSQAIRRPGVILALSVLVLACVLGAAWWYRHNSTARWARREAIPQIRQLVDKGEYFAAYRLARRAEPYAADDPALTCLRLNYSRPLAVKTEPAGADVFVKQYADVKGDWLYMGKSPLRLDLPLDNYRWKVEKSGFHTIESAAPRQGGKISFVLQRTGDATPDVVFVQSGDLQLGRGRALNIPAFFVGKYEVTNREFQRFVQDGGYNKQEYWKEKFLANGHELSWKEAMARFRDATGRPGPATWEMGEYPKGQADYPVGGVSWYEAAAYARYAGKRLPTIHEWRLAAGSGIFSDILNLSNFGTKGPAPVGTYAGIGPYGTYDMAGNVKEWCWNANGNARYILGGAWNDAVYMFMDDDAYPPIDRLPTYGFRLVQSQNPESFPQGLLQPVAATRARDYSKEKPVSDAIFAAYKDFYKYDRKALNAKVEAAEDSGEGWRKETISFDAAYGQERITAYLFLPKNISQPYQTVVFFPHSGMFVPGSSRNPELQFVPGSSRNPELQFIDFIIKSRRAVMFPVLKGNV
jgi:hypothetical protein